MRDFDDVLERLLVDPAFKAAVAQDPRTALAGYLLAPHEWQLLSSQLVLGEGEERGVETRATRSGVVGLVGPVAAALGVAASGLGSNPRLEPLAGATGRESFGTAPGVESFGAAPGVESFGNAPTGVESFGDASPSTEAMGEATGEAMGDAPSETLGDAPVLATGYRTWVDVDGDGDWDAHKVYERADGGVDIVADMDRDGRADFIGHDYDRDGLVDVADYDRNRDGTFDTRMHDDTGDGYMDRRERIDGDAK